jgi:hypothetical protein
LENNKKALVLEEAQGLSCLQHKRLETLQKKHNKSPTHVSEVIVFSASCVS